MYLLGLCFGGIRHGGVNANKLTDANVLFLWCLFICCCVFFLSRFPTQSVHNPISADHPDYSFVCPVYVLWAHQKLCTFKVKELNFRRQIWNWNLWVETFFILCVFFNVCFVFTVPHWSCYLQSDHCFWSLPWLFIATSIPLTSIYFWHSWVDPVHYIPCVIICSRLLVTQLSQLKVYGFLKKKKKIVRFKRLLGLSFKITDLHSGSKYDSNFIQFELMWIERWLHDGFFNPTELLR